MSRCAPGCQRGSRRPTSVSATTSWSWATTCRSTTVSAMVRSVSGGDIRLIAPDIADRPARAASARPSVTSCRIRPEALGGVPVTVTNPSNVRRAGRGGAGEVCDRLRRRTHLLRRVPGPEIHRRIGTKQLAVLGQQPELRVAHPQPIELPPADVGVRVGFDQVPRRRWKNTKIATTAMVMARIRST